MVPHFEARSRIDDFIRQDNRLLAETTSLWFGFCASNLLAPVIAPIYVVTSCAIIEDYVPITTAEQFSKVHPTVSRQSLHAD
jgi:hypothetical protein